MEKATDTITADEKKTYVEVIVTVHKGNNSGPGTVYWMEVEPEDMDCLDAKLDLDLLEPARELIKDSLRG